MLLRDTPPRRAALRRSNGDGLTLQPLLCLAWLAAILPIAAAALPIPAAGGGRILHQLLYTFSSRGKTFRASSSSSSKEVIYFGMLIARGGSDISVWFLYLFVEWGWILIQEKLE
ncbi:polyprenol reductase 1 [Panicum miliaceum]|uniref:Polyprenol reductase 1 n=1 Tax=Panicum miliaceum TaxID=4540 RepID=A0A3L6REC0_PANMI|nr:polyprenol reductase 1 [Panicum miliaceum]